MATSPFQTPSGIRVPAVTTEEMRAVDRVAVEDIGIELLQMMENAGRTLSWHVEAVGEGPVLVIAGNGGNGGGGLACARHLANRDVEIEIVLDRHPDDLTGVTARQYRILDEMAVPIDVRPGTMSDRPDSTVFVDALIGYGLSGRVRDPAERFIESTNRHDGPVVSLDVPSGIDTTTGEPLGTAVSPDRTVTLALPKVGLSGRNEPLFLADISVPHAVYERLDIEYRNPFVQDGWIELVQ